jgi:cytochrome P450
MTTLAQDSSDHADVRPAPPRPSRTIPGPSIPAWVQTAQFTARPDLFMERNWARFGDVFSARILSWGTGRDVFLADPALIQQMFRASPHTMHLGEIAGTAVTPIAGPDSILSLDAPKHLEHRKIVNPPMHGARMRRYADVMADAADRSIAGWPIGTPFALHDKFTDMSMDVIMSAIFGVERGERHDQMSRAASDLIDPGTLLGRLALNMPRLRRDFGPLRHWSTFQAHKAKADALNYDEMARRRKSADLTEREDILSLLLQTEFSDSEIHDELITLIIAGHETTGTALAWTFDLLLHHPRVMQRLREELASGDEEYLDAVVHESLRLRPVVSTSQRVVKHAIQLGEYLIEPETTLFAANWLVHRRRDLYGPDPYAFRPERFLGVRPGTYEWIPFGGGVRRCLGANFAPAEMKIIIRQVVTQTELEPASPKLERPQNRVVLLAPKNGTMAVRRR